MKHDSGVYAAAMSLIQALMSFTHRVSSTLACLTSLNSTATPAL